MVRVIWTEQAAQDLENIAEFISKDSAYYAKITVENIRSKAKLLKEKPFLGRVVPEAGRSEIRELIYGNYRIIYSIASNELLHMLAVYHSARLLRPADIMQSE